MSRAATSKKDEGDFPEFVVTREAFNRYFEKPIPTSTFHDLVNKGKITPFKAMRGHYLLNASLRRLGLEQVRTLPHPPPDPALEDVIRLAFSLIDPVLFPEPPWLLYADAIHPKDADHAVLIAEVHRANFEKLPDVEQKLDYFQGAIDWATIMEKEDD